MSDTKLTDSTPDRATLAARLRDVADWMTRAIGYGPNTSIEVAIVRQAADALDAPAPTWQDIATAPQMRKVIVFYRNSLDKPRTVMACYYKARSLEMEDDYADVGEYDEGTGESYAPAGWYEDHQGDAPLMPLDNDPTHWMPLPVPPAPATDTQEREG